ncbi:hypothetical protein HC725_12190 [Vibrio sp. S17_S38]|uniref:hypothetical protein n=1 Tax=Vibrio sp. S17_S38 TaxID=2720229 RepID=UPI0016805ADD|nr:hypothetical protein [Vibrio sp. S17_S38]MBD1574026.1 hypothetical protein [Vibrio sp. S17_S38]
MKAIYLCCVVLFGLITTPVSAATTESLVRQVIDENLDASQREDSDAYMATMHSQSLAWIPTKKAIQGIFGNYKLNYYLEQFHYIAQENEYAYARVWIRTTKVSGPSFNNNKLEALIVFKKEGEKWKVWSQANMQIQYID